MNRILEAFKRAFIRKQTTEELDSRFRFDGPWVETSSGKFTLVFDEDAEKRFALKLIDRKKLNATRERFKELAFSTESEIAKSISSPFVVKTFEIGKYRNYDFLLMENVEGFSLKHLLSNRSELLKKLQMRLIFQLAKALLAIHDSGFSHGNLCSKNVLIEKKTGSIKVIDFGHSLPDMTDFHAPKPRATATAYMAPEILRRKPSDLRADIFAFGVLAFQICSFQHPWGEGGTRSPNLFDTSPPTRLEAVAPTTPTQLVETIHECLDPTPAKRCQTMKQVTKKIREAIK